jgi:hypothetical protein
MFLYVRKSFMIFKIVLACIGFLAAIIALLGTSQNSMLLTQESGKQLAIVMALVFAIITIVEAFIAAAKQTVTIKLTSCWQMVRKQAPDSPDIFCGICPKALHPHNRG